jgi:hypothetical protein
MIIVCPYLICLIIGTVFAIICELMKHPTSAQSLNTKPSASGFPFLSGCGLNEKILLLTDVNVINDEIQQQNFID